MSASSAPLPSTGRAQTVQVGGVQLTGLIGTGALGEVHRGVDLATGTAVAVKLVRLPAHAPDRADARHRFLAEANAAGRLQHPGIAHLWSAGEDAGRGWLVMELLAGRDLQRHTTPAALLPLPTVQDIGAQLADALAHAHRHGVLHRDLKPANVVFDPATGRAALTDFGLARLADAAHTRTGMLLGTPAYMAPELLAGSTASVAADLYALGVLLFELTVGRLPHTGVTMGALLRQVAGAPAPALDTLRGGLPPGLSALVAQLLAKNPRQRPADGVAVAACLRALSGPPVSSAGGPDDDAAQL